MHKFLLISTGILLFLIPITTTHAQGVSSETCISKVGDPDSSIKAPGPLGCTKTSGGRGNFTYYCQGDPKWANSCGAGDSGMNACYSNPAQSSYCGMGNSGCGPTSLAMIMSSFGVVKTPLEVDVIYQQNGYRLGCGAGSDTLMAISSQWFKDLGFEVGAPIEIGSDGHPNLNQMRDALSNGYLIINNGDSYPCLGCGSGPDYNGVGVGHIFVIDDVDIAGNRIHTRDPNNCSYQTGVEVQEHAWVSLSLPRSQYGASNAVWKGAWPIRHK